MTQTLVVLARYADLSPNYYGVRWAFLLMLGTIKTSLASTVAGTPYTKCMPPPIAHPRPSLTPPLTFTFTLFITHDRLIPRSRFSASVFSQPCTPPHPRTCNNSKDVVIVNPPEFICVSITVFSSSLLPRSHNPHVFACLSVLVTLPSMAPFNISMFIVIMVLRPD